MEEPQRTIRICEQHGVPLYLLGCVLTRDEDEAATIVANVIGQSFDGPAAADLRDQRDARRRLARRVYLKGSRHDGSRARPAAPGESGSGDAIPPAVQWLMGLPLQQRTVIALCMFGAHTCRDAAVLMRIEAQRAGWLLRAGCARSPVRGRTRSRGRSARSDTSTVAATGSAHRAGNHRPGQSVRATGSNSP